MPGKIVVITGAARGLGRALVEAFLADGATVCGLVRSDENLRTLSQQLSTNAFHGFMADVTDYGAISRTVGEIESRVGPIDYWFNNAAIYPKQSFLDETPELFNHCIAVNVVGVANCCKAVLPAMMSRNTGKIFNLGSWAHLGPIMNSAAYSSSKGAIHTLTKSIARDLAAADSDVQVHEWIPGHLNTRMSDYTGIDPKVSAGWAVQIAQMETSSRNSIFENDHEWQPPKSLKQKLKALILRH